MSNSLKLHRLMPQIIKILCWNYDAWIVGSTAVSLIEYKKPEDWDIIVPPEKWNESALFLSTEDIEANSFGGWKIRDYKRDYNIDVWPDNLNSYFLRCQKAIDCAAYHPKSGILVKRELI